MGVASFPEDDILRRLEDWLDRKLPILLELAWADRGQFERARRQTAIRVLQSHYLSMPRYSTVKFIFWLILVKLVR